MQEQVRQALRPTTNAMLQADYADLEKFIMLQAAAHGACVHCGCAIEECECPSGSSD